MTPSPKAVLMANQCGSIVVLDDQLPWPRSDYRGGIWKRRFHFDAKPIKCFPSTLRWRDSKSQQSQAVLNLRFRDITCMVFEAVWFSKSSVFKMFYFHQKTKSRCFQLPQAYCGQGIVLQLDDSGATYLKLKVFCFQWSTDVCLDNYTATTICTFPLKPGREL